MLMTFAAIKAGISLNTAGQEVNDIIVPYDSADSEIAAESSLSHGGSAKKSSHLTWIILLFCWLRRREAFHAAPNRIEPLRFVTEPSLSRWLRL
jgi:hypothetical protein